MTSRAAATFWATAAVALLALVVSVGSAQPANPAVTAYGGASATLRAKAALAPLDKMGRAEEFMNRGAKGRKLLDDVLASPLLEKAPLPFQGTVWLRAAELAAKDRRADDARRWLSRIVERNAPQAERARAMLKELA